MIMTMLMLEEIRQRKQDLASEIKNLIVRFEQQTTVKVESVYLDRVDTTSISSESPGSIVASVTVSTSI
jgi:hypothetical protein